VLLPIQNALSRENVAATTNEVWIPPEKRVWIGFKWLRIIGSNGGTR